ncbi:MAG: hypothetical protein BWY19_00197 [bacterium ADurb.Bin212]|nr:MAG: hypothetical protein BWY19_00197 [bacterium ADurb.Bin212]
MPVKTSAPMQIAKPIEEYTKILLERSKFSGLPELVIYPIPPITKKPAASKPAMVTRTWMTFVAKFWTLERSGAAKTVLADKSTIQSEQRESQRERRRSIYNLLSPLPKRDAD